VNLEGSALGKDRTVDVFRGSEISREPIDRCWSATPLHPRVPFATENGNKPWRLTPSKRLNKSINGCAAPSQRFLRNTPPPDLAVVVLNASQSTSQLRLVLHLQHLGIPTVVTLNMSDEARRFGIRVDAPRLEERLGLPVVAISARHNQRFVSCWSWAPGRRNPACH